MLKGTSISLFSLRRKIVNTYVVLNMSWDSHYLNYISWMKMIVVKNDCWYKTPKN